MDQLSHQYPTTDIDKLWKDPQNESILEDVVGILDQNDLAKSWAWAPNTTHLIKAQVFATGDCNLIAVEKLHKPQNIPRKPREKESRKEMTAASLASSAARSKKRFVEKVLQMQAQHMLTGTTREPVFDREEFDAMLKRFTKEFQKRYPKIQYALVVEKHKSGALHWHMAASCPKGYVPYAKLHKLWRAAITGNPYAAQYPKNETPGNVHGTKTGRGRLAWETGRLARYIGK